MNLRVTLGIAGATMALAAPAVAGAKPHTTTIPSASQQCKTERTQMGNETFAATYGTNADRSNAFGKCVSHRRADTREAKQAAHTNAARQCKAAQAADAQAFAERYGSGHNAYGTCVSQTARAKEAATVAKQVRAEVKAARQADKAKD